MGGGTNGGRDRGYRALRESEELHRATLGNISDAVFLTDDAGVFTFICPNVDVIFGYVPDEVQAFGRIDRLLGPDLFDGAQLARAGEIRNVEREVVAKSGERRTVLIHLKRVAIQGGTVLYSCRDVTELRRTERELAVTRLELAHAARLALVGELMSSIVHQIQQPLTAIVLNAQAGISLLSGGTNGAVRAELSEILGDISNDCNSVAAIIDRLKSLARKRPLELQELDLNDVVDDVLQLVSTDAGRRHVSVRAELEPGLPKVDGDRVCLQQVILNLVVNAMDAMDQTDEREREVTLRTRLAGVTVEVTVSDRGHGIPRDQLLRIFDPFFTTKSQGIGLGLAVARSIVDAHAGQIWAEGNEGRGATLHMVVPMRPIAC
jgi:PAS domain S-box-containing protein